MRWPILLSSQDLEGMFNVLPRSSTIAPIVVSGFSQYKTQVSDLPASEQAKVDGVAGRIIAGYLPARLPIVGVLFVGHADQDLSRGAAFEQQISVERAQLALDAVRRALRRRGGSPLVSLLAQQVPMRAVGGGARTRLFQNPINEQQRASNRRVEIFLAEANASMPQLLPSAIPPQKHMGASGPIVRSPLVSASFVPLTTLNVTAPLAGAPTFVEGQPRRPPIKHDHGFLDDGKGNIDPSKRRQPTAEDHNRKEVWRLLLGLSMQHKPELKDANAAYKHFLIDNTGFEITFDYESFLKDDGNGQIVLQSAIEDTRAGVLDLFDRKFPRPATAARKDVFSATSTHVTVGGTPPDFRYSYPRTENWQKTIGGHALWLSADVIVDNKPEAGIRAVTISLTLHADDMYNFVPGGGDGATGIADAENGRFEITGLGTEFLQKGTATRRITFTVPNAKQADNRVLPADQQVTAK